MKINAAPSGTATPAPDGEPEGSLQGQAHGGDQVQAQDHAVPETVHSLRGLPGNRMYLYRSSRGPGAYPGPRERRPCCATPTQSRNGRPHLTIYPMGV